MNALTNNRNFIRVEVAGVKYKALYDTGVQITIVGSKLANAFRGRLQGNQKYIKMPPTLIKSKTLGYLDVTVEIDGHSKNMRWRVANYLDDVIMLGANFKNLWHIDSRSRKSEWLAEKVPWHNFWSDDSSDKTVVFVEFSGLHKITAKERAKSDAIVE